ncbi:hypothetical protein ACWCQN_36105 [Streptomyces sp. NPDC001984]|uniref:hypothetical protein n=1 Tax=Streptomyces sp. NPDC002619 TaxID=3364655 RepID=UPI003696E169
MKRLFGRAAMPHWAEFLVLLATICPADRLYSLTVAGRFAHWNEWLRPVSFTLGVLVPLVFIVMPGVGALWKSLHAAATK